MPSYRSNVTHKTVKLTPRSSDRNPTRPICKRLNADAPKPPTYPFILSIFKERSRDKINRGASFLAFPRPPCLQIFRLSALFPLSRFRRFRPSPSLFRFGEAVFTEDRRQPQEEKMRKLRFFSETQIYPQNLGVGAIFATIRRVGWQDNLSAMRFLV